MTRPLRRVHRVIPFLFWALLPVIWFALQTEGGPS